MTEFKFDEPLATLLERELTSRFGPMVSNDNLRITLGYASKEAFGQAISRKTVPVPIFDIENRRGKFALVKDIAVWLGSVFKGKCVATHTRNFEPDESTTLAV